MTSLSVRLFNVKYSPNLGDGLLSICLERSLIAAGAARDSRSIDLAARTAFGPGTSSRRTLMRTLDLMPQSLRRASLAVPLRILSERSWRPHYEAELAGGERVVVGGGNLLTDADLNFPTKLSVAMSVARERRLPVSVFGVGVGAAWSRRGRTLFSRALNKHDVQAVFVRDAESAENWRHHMGPGGLEPEIVRDPGLLASDLFGAGAPLKIRADTVGIGIMSAAAINYHSDVGIGASALSSWYVALVRILLARGARVVVFTNGSPEDVATFEELRPTLTALAEEGQPVSLRQPRTPEQLCAIISGCASLLAFRMHAVIAAYAYDVPPLALRWDRKLDAFMKSVGLQDWLVSFGELRPEEAAQRLLVAAGDRELLRGREAVVDEARADVVRLYARLAEGSS